MKFVSKETLIDITKKYLKTYYDKLEVDEKKKINKFIKNNTIFSNYLEFAEHFVSASDIGYPDLYNCNGDFLNSQYMNEVKINGKTYSMFACWIPFTFYPYLPDYYFLAIMPCFTYYEFVDKTNSDGTVGSSMRAEKLYSYEIDKEYFPEWVNIMGKRDLRKLVDKTTKFVHEEDIKI